MRLTIFKSGKSLMSKILGRVAIVGFVFLSQVGCSSWSQKSDKEKILISTAVGTIVGAALGAANTPSGESRDAWTVLGASAGAASVGFWAVYKFDSDGEKLEEVIRLNEDLKRQVNECKEKAEPELLDQGITMKAPLPSSVRSLITPGEWKRYKLDEWAQDPENQNIWYRRTEMFEVIPGTSRSK